MRIFMTLRTLLVLVAATAALADTIRVPADQGTLQDAIDAAAPGDTILISKGTYDENPVIDNKQDLTLKAKGNVVLNCAGDLAFRDHVVVARVGDAAVGCLDPLTLVGSDARVIGEQNSAPVDHDVRACVEVHSWSVASGEAQAGDRDGLGVGDGDRGTPSKGCGSLPQRRVIS
jgi:hypothetical protein